MGTRQTTYLLTADVAKVAGVTPRMVKLWDKAGRLVPAMRTKGGVRLYDEATVEAFLKRRAAGKKAR